MSQKVLAGSRKNHSQVNYSGYVLRIQSVLVADSRARTHQVTRYRVFGSEQLFIKPSHAARAAKVAVDLMGDIY